MRCAARVEGSAVRWYRYAVGNNRRSFDCAAARPAKAAGRKVSAGAPLRTTSSSSWIMQA